MEIGEEVKMEGRHLEKSRRLGWVRIRGGCHKIHGIHLQIFQIINKILKI